MSTAVATPAPSTTIRARLSAAAQRAMAEGLSARMNQDGTWACKSYTIVPFGTSAVDVRCDCPAGFAGLICKHTIPVIFGRKYGLVAVTAKAPVLVDVAPSTPEDVAYSEQLKAEVVHQFATGSPTLLATRGVDPLAEAFA